MAAKWIADDAFAKFKELLPIIRATTGANEDTTRLRAIDTILFDVLQWDKAFVETEKYARDAGFADYVFSNDIALMVLEAKKDNAAFVLPLRDYESRPVQLSLIASESAATASAMRQAAGYATNLGARYVAISNGHQWLLALAYVPGQVIEDRSVFVFESLDAISARFDAFWNCFSPTAIRANVPSARLLEARKAPAPAKLSAQIPNYPASADRNILRNALGPFTQVLWDEINQHDDDDTFLSHCYAKPDSQEDNLAVAKELLEHRAAMDELAAKEAKDVTEASSLIRDYSTERPIVLLGRVGHGKTTFLRYLRRIAAKQALEKYIQIDIEFLDRPDTREEIPEYIYNAVSDQLRERYNIDITEDGFARAALHGELNRFKKTTRGKSLVANPALFQAAEVDFIESCLKQRYEFLTHVFRHLRAQRQYSVAIFLDNLDRRLPEIQADAFLRASAMARDWAAMVFVCLRPGTFYESRERGVLDSVAPKVLVVSAPRADVVLRLRFRFAASVADGSIKIPAVNRKAFSADTTKGFEDVAKFFAAWDESLRTRTDLTHLFDAVSNGDIRALLRYARTVMTSGHLNTSEMLEKIERTGDYTISQHQTLRALLYGDYLQYNPSYSVFVNLFDVVRADPLEHFSRFFALHYLNRFSTGSASHGFCKLEDLCRYLTTIGYTRDHVDDILGHLYDRDCCEAKVYGVDWKDIGHELRITHLGRYHITELVRTFAYVDAIVIDTPIIDPEARRHIRLAEPVEERLARAREFLRYLNHCASDVTDVDALRLWTDVHDAIASDITDIEKRIA
jgi:hypothetical protein